MSKRKSRDRKPSITKRVCSIINKSRSLSIEFVSPWNDIYHRRHCITIDHRYGSESPIDSVSLTKVGKILRNRKHHIPKYKIERCDLDWAIMVETRSVSKNWRTARYKWIKHCRNVEKLQTKHLDKMILTHWWKI